jgi:hypothetical protein
VTYHVLMTGPERQRVDERDELLRAAAAERLGEDPEVIVIRRSDEQLRKEAEDLGLTEARAQK